MTLLQFVSEAKHETGERAVWHLWDIIHQDSWKEGGGHEDSGHGICICEKKEKTTLPADLARRKME